MKKYFSQPNLGSIVEYSPHSVLCNSKEGQLSLVNIDQLREESSIQEDIGKLLAFCRVNLQSLIVSDDRGGLFEITDKSQRILQENKIGTVNSILKVTPHKFLMGTDSGSLVVVDRTAEPKYTVVSVV